ncbi:ISAs1 family transposase [Actinoplanes derwentensis]|uniref:Transposase DDE domain-containing protein n=1 Tax=Actinoplanes derwentensis TaxID=113562 RepID=A0A1H2D862_9ACTN|nr:ISAs1 family transposase [Actinoplanes derwentensis]SDS78961.1 Transposase DDE domain-containing protein [Actinoplanes derwentensis]SDT55442.1 Transposase DDE domain-containing protein [Actinoplanes derwentensis]SDT78933.1 Transposase DDE domain-containing protein [Actinoplanes derwentensis]SDT80360.1 Transposase DDE domain-containing protein [Actinoplanes derwentensis]SDT80652.1 Transposase DDE domain-containing protein [Actinoplanes derwentensis]
MASSLIRALTVTTPGSDTPPSPVTDSEHTGLAEALGRIPDPRNPHGTRYSLVALLTVAVCAVLAGATSFAAIADWLYDLDEPDQVRLGFTRGVPAGTTMWRLLTRLDASVVSTVLAGWLRSRTPPAPARPRRYRTVIAVDGKTLRGARLPEGRQVHLLSALDTSTGIVLAQVTVDTKSNEIPAFTPLLTAVENVLGSLTGVLFVADAMHTQTDHAEQITRRGAHLLLQAKGNQPTLHTQLKTLPWAQIPVGDRTRDRGHGRKETRTVKAVTLHTPGGIAFPKAQQAARITRTRTIDGKTSRETTYLITSLSAANAQPTDLQKWARAEWLIENQVHNVRDVTFREDLHQARTGTGPAVMATLRNTAIGWHRINGATNIARANRRADRRSHDLITAVTSSYPRTQ